MVVDTSAVLAVLFAEEDRDIYIKALAGNEKKFMTPLNALEADIVVRSRKGEKGHHILERFFYNIEIDVLPFDQTMRKLAYEAWLKFGKGRNPACLNMGDCCAYALSTYLKEPLLYKGNDFSQTDILSFL